jgi:hypothetical protein
MATIYALPRLPQTTIVNVPLLTAMPDILNSSIFGGNVQEIVFKPFFVWEYLYESLGKNKATISAY